ncbi:uncharacterized protein H6S33_010361 [Morchella sextelata]|uniref:uncharacterized protein n=1 Tax=Morchella sextelata TaxID=1174677 RepID=UPI001D04618D|nr:uncharacterized protein H6S33_010361 [Morchella sextelata]KAH0612309.1 hypothetical protein H6S33_010361 [Morchella sextelata]
MLFFGLIIPTLAVPIKHWFHLMYTPKGQVADFTSTANVTGTPCGNVISSTPNAGSINGEYIVRQAQAICGSAHLNYCNRVEKKVLGTVSGALLAGTIPGTDDLVVQCLPLDMLLHDAQIPFREACDGKAACCLGDISQSGYVNLGCIMLSLLAEGH